MKVKLGGDFSKLPDTNPAPVGVFVAKIDAVDERESKNTGDPMVEVRWRIVRTADGKKLKDPKGKPVQYDPVFTYAPLDPDSSWARRMKELLHALNVSQKGTVDIKEGSEALLRLKEDQDQDGNYRPNVAKIMRLAETNGEPEEEPEAEAEEEDEEELDLSELNRTQLKALIKENELEIKVTKGMDDDAIREAIAEQLGAEDEEEPEDEEEDEDEEEEEPEAEAEEDEEDEEEVDLSELSRAELKDFIKEHELEVKVLKSDTADSLRIKIADALEEGEDEEEEEDDAVEDNYDELDVATLKQECKDRELEATGKKAVLIARLRADDASDPV